MYQNATNQIAAQQKQSYEAAGACIGGGVPAQTRPLEMSLNALHLMIDRLQDGIYRLQGTLSAVVHPEAPSAENKCAAQATSPVLIIQVVDMERDRIESLVNVVTSLEARLVL